MSKIKIYAIATALPLCIASCSSANESWPDAGHQISDRGDKITGFGDAWSEGQRRYKNGQSLVKKSEQYSANAEKQLTHAHGEVSKARDKLQAARSDKLLGKKMIADGSAEMERAKVDYAAIRQGPSAVGEISPN